MQQASFTPIDFQARRKRVAAAVKAAGFDAYVGTRQAGLHYLAGAFLRARQLHRPRFAIDFQTTITLR